MSDDKELLELAAKAAGYKISPHPSSKVIKSCMFVLNKKNWNPLEKSFSGMADCLQMEIDLKFSSIDYDDMDNLWLVYMRNSLSTFKLLASDSDRQRASTMAAAAIGRGM